MTTASTSAVLSQTSNANFQAWVQEVYTNLVTNCGLVQTNSTGQAAVPFAGTVPASTGVANTAGFYEFTFNDSLAGGSLATTALNSGGTGGSNATYTNLVVTGATSGATNGRASVTVSGGVAGNMTVTTAGSGYIVGEKLTVSQAGIPAAANWTAASLSSGAPVIFRLDFGSSSAGTADPQMWIVVGAGTNGAGTIAGTAATSRMTQVAVTTTAAPASTVTAYTSRYVYNSSLGYCGMVFKIGAATTNCAFGAFMLFRTNDSGGNPTTNAVALITNYVNTTGITNNTSGAMQCMTWNSGAGSTIYPTLSSSNSILWLALGTSFPFGLTTTLENSTAFVTPIYTMDPGLKFSAYNGVALVADFPLGNTATYAMIGSTTLTFISVGVCFGNPSGGGFGGINNVNLTFCMLWQ